MKTVLTIAGSDSSGGAGIQADIKTILAHKLYAASAVTALTAQNTLGVYGVLESTPEFLECQLTSVFDDIPPDAVKIGMVSSAELISCIAGVLKMYHPGNVVLDPVMISTSGRKLLDPQAAGALREELLPLADLLTPNIPEAEVLSHCRINSREDREEAARRIAEQFHSAVLIKGGHGKGNADDLLFYGGTSVWYAGERLESSNTHGTGCTLSSAIACRLAKGETLEESVRLAKQYLTGAIRAGLDLGRGNGPLDHGYWLRIDEENEKKSPFS